MELSNQKTEQVIEITKLMNSEVGSTTAEWGFLGQQIKDTFDEIMTNPKTNQIKFLQHLTDICNGKIKL